LTKIKKLIAVTIAALMIFASGCGLLEKKPEAIQKQNVAKVGNEYITRGQLDQLYSYYLEVMKSQTPNFDENDQSTKDYLNDMKKSMLEQIIDLKVLEQNAKELKLIKDDNELNDEMKKLIDTEYKAGKSDDDYNKWMTENHYTPEILNTLVRFRIIDEKTYDYVTKNETVTDDEAKNQYNTNQYKYTEKPSTMEVSHILVDKNSEALAKEIKDKLDKGGDFKALSDQYSIDDAAKADGGSLGEIKYTEPNYDPTFMIAAIGLKEGEISQPVLTQFGWHIIKIDKKTEYPVLPFDNVKDDIKEELLNAKKEAKYSETLAQWKEKAAVEKYEDNLFNVK
jgi:foldase protein PrsA